MGNSTTAVQIENLTDAEFDGMDNLHDAAQKFCGRYARIDHNYLVERDRKIRARGRARYLARHAVPVTPVRRLPFGEWLLQKAANNRPTRCIPIKEGGQLETLYWLDECEECSRAPKMPKDPANWEEVADAMRQNGCGERDIAYGFVAWAQYSAL